MPRKPPDIAGTVRKGSPEEKLLRQIDLERLPDHVAVIMDGNGRWAAERGLPRVFGHRQGITAVRETVETCARLGLDTLTLYAFSVENWKRPPAEVRTLMSLLREYLRKEIRTLLDNDIRFRPIGRIDDLDPAVRKDVRWAERETAACRGLLFQIALSYGGRTEIVDAARSVCAELRDRREGPEAITEERLAEHLYTAGCPDPDLLIRTSGELRVSNFLLWQIAYAEIWVTPVLWPDFRRIHLFEAIRDFQRRDRRFGGIRAGGGKPARAGTGGRR